MIPVETLQAAVDRVLEDAGEPTVKVSINPNLRTSGARTMFSRQCYIEFAGWFAEVADAGEIRETAIHECAHVMVWRTWSKNRKRRMPIHGPEFMEWMALLGSSRTNYWYSEELNTKRVALQSNRKGGRK